MWRSFIQPHRRRLSSWRWKGWKKKKKIARRSCLAQRQPRRLGLLDSALKTSCLALSALAMAWSSAVGRFGSLSNLNCVLRYNYTRPCCKTAVETLNSPECRRLIVWDTNNCTAVVRDLATFANEPLPNGDRQWLFFPPRQLNKVSEMMCSWRLCSSHALASVSWLITAA